MAKPTFSSVYAIIYFTCNVNIVANSYLYIIFPYAFDNFNNNNINIIFKKATSVALVTNAIVTDRTLEIFLNATTVTLNTAFSI